MQSFTKTGINYGPINVDKTGSNRTRLRDWMFDLFFDNSPDKLIG